METGLQFYLPLRCVSFENPEILQLVFNNQLVGQNLKKDLWIRVKHSENLSHGAFGVESRFHTFSWVSFEDNDQQYPFKKINLGLVGEYCPERTTVYANLSYNLERSDLISCFTLSPVPYNRIGEPQIPDEPGLKNVIKELAKVHQDSWSTTMLMGEIRDWTEKVAGCDSSLILRHLRDMGIVSKSNGGRCRLVMNQSLIEKLFRNQIISIKE